MPFLYRLHYSFALGDWGLLAFGIAALIWTLDCFVGFYLTLPTRRKTAGLRPSGPATRWWPRWKPAWMVRWHAGRHKLTFDLHRAGGLWLWPILLVFAWSGVFFNLSPVYNPVMGMFGYESLQKGIVPPARPRLNPRIGFREAAAIGHALAERETKRLGIAMVPDGETALLHRPDAGLYAYIFSSSADMRTLGGRSLALFDSNSGKLVKLVLPQGQNGANTVTEWISAIHMAAIWGLPWTIATSLIGLGTAMLSVTGLFIWMKKRAARRSRSGRTIRHGKSAADRKRSAN